LNGKKEKKRKKGQQFSYIKRGEPGKICIFCGKKDGLIRRYGLCICRGCFRERARSLGFHKYG